MTAGDETQLETWWGFHGDVIGVWVYELTVGFDIEKVSGGMLIDSCSLGKLFTRTSVGIENGSKVGL